MGSLLFRFEGADHKWGRGFTLLENSGERVRSLGPVLAVGVVDQDLAVLGHAAQHDVVAMLSEDALVHVRDHRMPAGKAP